MIQLVSLDDLRPDPANPKWHAQHAIEASLRRFGLGAPFIVDSRTELLSAGHGRREALLAMRARRETPPAGVEIGAVHPQDGARDVWLVPAVTWASTDDHEARAFLIASNRLTEEGGWKAPDLAAILDELGPTRLDGVGFDQHDLATVRAAAAVAVATTPIPKASRLLECPACRKTFAAPD